MFDVIIPTRNAESVLETCLSSLRKQTVPVRIIIVDARSTDRTLEIAQKYGCEIYEEPKSNVKGSRRAVACNEGLRHVTSNFFGFLDSDVEVPERWAEEMEHLMKDYEYGVVEDDINIPIPIAAITSGCESDKSTSLSKAINFVMRLGSKHAQKFDKVVYLESTPGYNSIYYKNIINKVGEFNESLGGCEDLEYNMRARSFGYKLLGVPNSPVIHYERKNYFDFLKQIKGYGWSMGRLYNVKKTIPKTRFLPLIFTVLCSLMFILLPIFSLEVIFSFGFIILLNHLLKKSWFYIFLLLPIFFLLQITYSVGFVCGIME